MGSLSAKIVLTLELLWPYSNVIVTKTRLGSTSQKTSPCWITFHSTPTMQPKWSSPKKATWSSSITSFLSNYLSPTLSPGLLRATGIKTTAWVFLVIKSRTLKISSPLEPMMIVFTFLIPILGNPSVKYKSKKPSISRGILSTGKKTSSLTLSEKVGTSFHPKNKWRKKITSNRLGLAFSSSVLKMII